MGFSFYHTDFCFLAAYNNTVKHIILQQAMDVKSEVNTNVVNTVGVKQAGAFAVTQGGEFVVQLAGGGTLPVYVQGGRLVADIAGGLEGLAVQLADEEVSLRAVGAL